MSTYLTYITGIATLLGFVLQLKDTFPQHREARKGILYICFGIFIGSIFGAINSIDIQLNSNYGIVSVVLVGILVILALALIIMTFTAFNSLDLNQRGDLFGAVGFGVFIFFLILAALAFSTGGIDKKSNYSASEKMAMAKHNLESKNYERAIELYKSSIVYFQLSDPRRKKVELIIKKAKEEMASGI
jgi:hypothetical protein